MLNTDQKLTNISNYPTEQVSPEELEYMAYTGQYELVNTIVKEIPERLLPEYLNKDVLNQTIWGSIEKLKKLLSLSNHELVEIEKVRLLYYMRQFISYCDKDGIYPREIFESIIFVSEMLISLQNLDLADELLIWAFDKDISRFPGLRVNALNKLALIQSKKGDIDKSLSYLTKLAERPYLITDRNQFAEILYNLAQSLLKNAKLESYYDVLFYSLSLFYSDTDLRRKITQQISRSYKNSLKVLLGKNITLTNKFLYIVHWFYFNVPDFSKVKLGIINKLASKTLLGALYVLNFVITPDSFLGLISGIKAGGRNSLQLTILPEEKEQNQKGLHKNILITRAMGGIGDLLMMTPGIHALKKKYPKREIHLAIPRRYFPVFECNEDLKLIDIEDDTFSHHAYRKWYNLSDCPAARVESHTAPKVKKSRIDLFAKGFGIHGLRLINIDRKPRFFFNDEECEFAEEFWKSFELHNKKVIGVQIHSDESYRDYIHMEKLVKILSEFYTVLVFHNLKIRGYNFNNVIKIDNLSLRNAFRLAYKCDLIVAPDSSFIHFGAAFNIPTIGLFGPIDGKIRTKHYPNCVYIDVREQLGCLPCWRNESMPCELTGLRNSVCMESISVQRVKQEADKILKGISI